MYTFDHDLFSALNFDGGTAMDRVMLTVSGTAMWLPLYALILWLVWRRSGWRGMLEVAKGQIEASLQGLYRLALGGTAVGTGLNAPSGFDEEVGWMSSGGNANAQLASFYEAFYDREAATDRISSTFNLKWRIQRLSIRLKQWGIPVFCRIILF